MIAPLASWGNVRPPSQEEEEEGRCLPHESQRQHVSAHIQIVVNETGPPALARFVPQNAGVVYESTKHHRRWYGAQDPHFDPLYPQGERSLVVSNNTQRRGKCGHRAKERYEHVTKSEDDEGPQVRASCVAGSVYRLVADHVVPAS